MTIRKLAGATALALVLSSAIADARRYDMPPNLDRHDPRGAFSPSVVFMTYHVRSHRHHTHARVKPRHSTVRQITVPAVMTITERHGVPLPPRRPDGEPSLVAKARAHLGGNPTGWRSVWCGRFMAMIAPKAARRIRNPNLARSWAELPHVKPAVGVIVVLWRGGGGHVGVITGFAKNGDLIVISGNHGHKVGIGTYDRRRALAFVTAT